MIGSVTEAQQQMAELARRREAIAAQQASPALPLPGGVSPAAVAVPGMASAADGLTPATALKAAGESRGKVPRPAEEHIRWAQDVMRRGYGAPVSDRHDALELLSAAGLDHRDFDGARQPDDSGGARDLAADLRDRAREDRAREQGEQRSPSTTKDFSARGISEGPDDSLAPGRPLPEDFRRGYESGGHAAPSPMADPPRVSPFSHSEAGILTPVELPGEPLITGIPGALTNTAAAHHAKVTLRPPIPRGETR